MSSLKRILDHTVELLRTAYNNLSNCKIFYITERARWSTYWDGRYITEEINRQGLASAKISYSDHFIRNRIIHYGTKYLVAKGEDIQIRKSRNSCIFTWFHIIPGDPTLKKIKELFSYFEYVHVSCSRTRDRLVEHGAPEEKFVVIPLGVDTSLFTPASVEECKNIRKALGIPEDVFCIGSFQKDGIGWGEGLEPKMEKGPDILCDVLERLNQKYPLHVLLTGPARGYVKRRLEKKGIPYSHYYLNNYLDIGKYYKALDLYLITSREEGGPKAIVEAMACGVPLVTTDVGMAGDVITEGENGFICESRRDIVEELTDKAGYVIENLNRDHYSKKASTLSRLYDWSNIARSYYEKMYRNLI
jgi:glycosyltransferase involved in cell wall biosynthesis